jgi:hypothetical protein
MPRKSPIPDSQRMLARNIARRAWRESMCNGDRAKDLLGGYLSREIGQGWLREATDIAEMLIEHWDELDVHHPTVHWVEGEPV